ncbi:PocR ligand-binding domain-containing protein [Peptoniphilus sp. MSJ-1]|uniref:PocR ligand-binding domain-containing protein n=1 Tax=Peptoniphilus ovalis TaxID=2841503 RepID=A0ABS6FI84_9FIRM|nr:PocR ligand-binding domain-containing protein [Peptoniphilus ovalis]
MYINKENIPNIKINEKYTNGIDGIDIYSIFGREYLEQIQKVISDVTGLAFVTIDYKGEPLTEMTNFSRRCQHIRKNAMHKKICELSDASGAIRAAVSKKTSIYFCPFNLLEVAIPIIINDKYLGAFIGGQAICEDPPEKVIRMKDQLLLEDIDYSDIDFSSDDVHAKKYTFKEFESTVKLIELIISEIIKKELISSYHENKNKNKIKALEEKVLELEEKNFKLKTKLSSFSNSVNTLFLNNMMESLSNLALIEEAHNTSEYSEHLRKFIIESIDVESNSANYVKKTLLEYFMMKKIQYKDRFQYEINIDDDSKEMIMPLKVLIAYVVVMCFLGLSFNEGIYNIKVNFKKKEDFYIVVIDDNGPGITSESLEKLKANQAISDEIENVFGYISQLEEDIKKIFGGEPEIKIEEKNKNTKISIKYHVKS